VGHPIRVGDVVTTLSGRAVSRSVVERVEGQRLLCRRGDGLRAIYRSGGVVVMQRRRTVAPGAQAARPGGLAS
jgi:hypothetical protein